MHSVHRRTKGTPGDRAEDSLGSAEGWRRLVRRDNPRPRKWEDIQVFAVPGRGRRETQSARVYRLISPGAHAVLASRQVASTRQLVVNGHKITNLNGLARSVSGYRRVKRLRCGQQSARNGLADLLRSSDALVF